MFSCMHCMCERQRSSHIVNHSIDMDAEFEATIARPAASNVAPVAFTPRSDLPVAFVPLDADGRRHGRSVESAHWCAYELTDWVHGAKHGQRVVCTLDGEMEAYIEYASGARHGLVAEWSTASGHPRDMKRLHWYGWLFNGEEQGWALARTALTDPHLTRLTFVDGVIHGTAYVCDPYSGVVLREVEYADDAIVVTTAS